MSKTAAAVALAAVSVLATACIVDTPAIENTQDAPTAAAVVPTAEIQFEPTAVPAPPTPVATATPAPAPTPTAEPEPTATAEPAPLDAPTPLPTSAPEVEFAPITVDAGPVTIPIAGTSFMLDEPRPVLQLGGHTLIYVDDQQQAEVDIFTPIADRNAQVITSYEDTIAYVTSQSEFGDVDELDAVTIAGLPTRVFSAQTGIESADAERAFITDVTALKDPVLGWYPPKRFQLWVIDRPAGPLIVTAESLEDPGQFDQALALAAEVLSTLDLR